jgi:hypothetical protein
MEKRSRRRIRDLVALAAFQGLSESKIGCAPISMTARSDAAPFKGRIRKRDQSSPDHHIRLATHGRSIRKCQEETWLVHRKSLPENAQRPRALTTFVSDGSPGQQESAAKRDHHKSRPIRFDFEAATRSFRLQRVRPGAKPCQRRAPVALQRWLAELENGSRVATRRHFNHAL